MLDSSQRQARVFDLDPNATYRFRVTAVYSNGENQSSNFSRRFRLRSNEGGASTDRPITEPLIYDVEPFDGDSLEISWQVRS